MLGIYVEREREREYYVSVTSQLLTVKLILVILCLQ